MIHTGPGQKEKKRYMVARPRTLGDLQDFVANLHDTIKTAKAAGGTYSVFLPLAGSVDVVLQIEVTVPIGSERK